MSATTHLDRCLRAIDEFRREVAETEPGDLDCDKLERGLHERLNAVGCAVMREVLERADTKAPRVTINGKAWGNRRERKGTYVTTFGEIHMPRSIYSQPGGGGGRSSAGNRRRTLHAPDDRRPHAVGGAVARGGC